MAVFGVFAVVVAVFTMQTIYVQTSVVDFNAVPDKQLSTSFDGSLTLHCEVPGNVTTAAQDLSITVYYESSSGEREIITSVSPHEIVNLVSDKPIRMSVHIADPGSVTDQSFLGITWIKFTKDLIGKYVCNAKVLENNVPVSIFENFLYISFMETTSTSSTRTTTTTPFTTTTTTTRPTTPSTTTTTTTRPTTPSTIKIHDPACTIITEATAEFNKYMSKACSKSSDFARYCKKTCAVGSDRDLLNDEYSRCVDIMKSAVCMKPNRSNSSAITCLVCPQITIRIPYPDFFRDIHNSLLSSCFPPLSTVLLETGERKFMKDLKIGDKPLSLTKNGDLVFSEVFMFLHRSSQSYTKYFVLKTNNGKEITASPEHLLYVLSKPFNSSIPGYTDVKLTEDIEIGDFVSTLTNNTDSRMELSADRVVVKETVFLQGMYAPVTTEGTIVVDDVIASCYAIYKDVETVQALFAPMRFVHVFSKLFPDWLMNSEAPMDSMNVHWYANLLWKHAPVTEYALNQWRSFQVKALETYYDVLPNAIDVLGSPSHLLAMFLVTLFLLIKGRRQLMYL